MLPSCGCIIVLLAQLLLWIDRTVRIKTLMHYSSGTATGVLAAIIGAMVALLGFVVTIGVLGIQQATATLSPRFMRLWYRDRLQKVVLLTFAGTFTYSFALLRRIETNFVPDLGVTIAEIAIAVSLILLLVYLNRFTHALRPVVVAEMVEQAGERVFDQWQQILARQRANSDHTGSGFDATAAAPVLFEPACAIRAIHFSGLVASAAEHDYLMVLGHTAGDFVAAGDVFVEIKTRAGGKPFLSPDPKQLRGLAAPGVERTIEQDPAFALRIIADIGIKAPSPAVNDPTTAVQILDYIETFLHRICTADLREQYPYADRTGIPRVEIPGSTWAEYLQLAVTEIRTYGTHSVQVCRRLRSLLTGLLAVAAPHRRDAIQAELSLLDESFAKGFTPIRPALQSRARATRKASVLGDGVDVPTQGGATSPGCDADLKHDVCEPIELIERRGGRVEIQFRDSRIPERLHGTADRGLGTEGAFGDHFGVVAEESVVVAQVLAGILLGLSAEGEVREGRKPRLLDPTGLPPGGCHPFDQGGRVLRWRASDGQSDGPVNDPAHRLVAGPPDEDWYPAGVDRRRTYRWGVAVNALTPPRFV